MRELYNLLQLQKLPFLYRLFRLLSGQAVLRKLKIRVSTELPAAIKFAFSLITKEDCYGGSTLLACWDNFVDFLLCDFFEWYFIAHFFSRLVLSSFCF